MVFIATMFTRKHKQMLKEYKVPIVILGQKLEGYPCVYQDDHQAAYMIADKLLEHGKSLPTSESQKRMKQLVQGAEKGLRMR